MGFGKKCDSEFFAFRKIILLNLLWGVILRFLRHEGSEADALLLSCRATVTCCFMEGCLLNFCFIPLGHLEFSKLQTHPNLHSPI